MFGDVTRVGANFHAQQAWGNLKKVNGEIGAIQSRLSTGKRINSAEDDTSGYALAKHLESRTRGLSQALDNVGTAKNVLNIAEGGYQAQMSLLQTMKEKATQAADGSWSTAQRGAIDDQVQALVTEFDDISADTKFNDNALFGSTTTFQVGEGASDTLAVAFASSTGPTVDLSTAADATTAITTLDTAIKSLSESIQSVGDFQARLSSKEESLSLAISNTEATRSRVEDTDFAKEQMGMMKLQILQQTTVSSFAQSNAAPQMVLGLFR